MAPWVTKSRGQLRETTLILKSPCAPFFKGGEFQVPLSERGIKGDLIDLAHIVVIASVTPAVKCAQGSAEQKGGNDYSVLFSESRMDFTNSRNRSLENGFLRKGNPMGSMG